MADAEVVAEVVAEAVADVESCSDLSKSHDHPPNSEEPPEVRLDSISNQFKGILMDIHSSMMGEEEEGVSSNPNLNLNTNLTDMEMPETEESSLSSNKPNQISEFAEDDIVLNNNQSCVLPTAIINESSDMQSDLLDNQGQGFWGDFSSSTQIPEQGYTSFSDPSVGTEPIKTETDFLTSTPEETEVVEEFKSSKTSFGGWVKSTLKNSFKIFVAQIPTGFKNEDLSKLFEPFGLVMECEIFPYKNFAFVHLDSEEAGVRAIKELNNKSIDGTRIRVQRSTSNPAAKPEFVDQEIGTYKLYISYMFQGVTKEYITQLLESYGRVVEIEVYRNNSAFVHMEEESAAKKVIEELNGKCLPECDRPLQVTQSKNPEGPSIATIKLQVKNVSNEVTPETIRDLFKPYGLVIKCCITSSKFDLLRKAVVDLEQLGDIRSAIKDLNGYELNGMKLVVEPLLDKPPPKKPPQCFQPVVESSYEEYESPSQLPGYQYDYEEYNYPPHQQFRPPHPSHRGRGRGRGNLGAPRLFRSQYQLIPMPSLFDINHMPRGRGGRPLRMMARGRGRGGVPPHQGFVPRFPKRPYQPNFNEDYDFDEYYQDPAVANSREHYSAMQEEYGQEYFAPADYPSNMLGGERPPPQKKSRGRGRGGGIKNIPSLFPAYMESESNNNEEIVRIPYHPHPYPSLNLPIGEREYYRNVKGANKTSKFQMNQQQQLQYDQLQQQTAAQSYLVPEQIPGTSTTHSDFQYSTAYPANYYTGVEDFSAVSFDYNSIKYKTNQPKTQQQFPEGVNPEDYPNLKPGAKVYVNGKGKVMVRGNRGGKAKSKKARRPGLGSKAGGNNTTSGVATGANQVQISTPKPGSSNANNFSNFYSSAAAGGNKKYKSKVQLKQENQEYTDWLQQKAWLFQTIPGTVRPAT